MITAAFALNRTRLTVHRNLPRQAFACRGLLCRRSGRGEEPFSQSFDPQQVGLREFGGSDGLFEASTPDQKRQGVRFAQSPSQPGQESPIGSSNAQWPEEGALPGVNVASNEQHQHPRHSNGHEKQGEDCDGVLYHDEATPVREALRERRAILPVSRSTSAD